MEKGENISFLDEVVDKDSFFFPPAVLLFGHTAAEDFSVCSQSEN